MGGVRLANTARMGATEPPAHPHRRDERSSGCAYAELPGRQASWLGEPEEGSSAARSHDISLGKRGGKRTPGAGRRSPTRRETAPAASPVSIEGRFIIPGRAQHLLRVDGDGGPDALVGALQCLVVGGEDVEGAGHAGGGEVGQVLAALLLLVQLALVAVAPRAPALRAAGAAGERRRDTTHRASLTLGRGNARSRPLIVHRLILD